MSSSQQSLVYLDAAQVEAALPPIAEQLELARRTMVALVADADLPPKIAVHPRPADSFAHAMPAWLRGPRDDGSADLLGIKWVLGFPENRTAGLPAISATVLLNDPLTGVPLAALDGAPITARRTAADQRRGDPGVGSGAAGGERCASRSSGPACRHAATSLSWPRCSPGPSCPSPIAMQIGRRPWRARRAPPGRSVWWTQPHDPSMRRMEQTWCLGLVSFGPHRQAIPIQAFEPGALVVAVDYDMCVPAVLARDAGLVPRRRTRAVPGQSRRRASSPGTRMRTRPSGRRCLPGRRDRRAAGPW